MEGVLLLAPCKDVHTMGMRRPIDVAFISSDGTVLDAVRNVGSNRRVANAHACATIERFSVEGPWFEPGDRVQHFLKVERPGRSGKGVGDEGMPDMPVESV